MEISKNRGHKIHNEFLLAQCINYVDKDNKCVLSKNTSWCVQKKMIECYILNDITDYYIMSFGEWIIDKSIKINIQCPLENIYQKIPVTILTLSSIKSNSILKYLIIEHLTDNEFSIYVSNSLTFFKEVVCRYHRKVLREVYTIHDRPFSSASVKIKDLIKNDPKPFIKYIKMMNNKINTLYEPLYKMYR